MPIRKLYHASRMTNRESILEKGIEPRKSKVYDHIYQDERIFLFENFDKPPLDFVGYEYIDIWEVVLDDDYEIINDTVAQEDGYENSFYIKKPIPSERISLVKTIL